VGLWRQRYTTTDVNAWAFLQMIRRSSTPMYSSTDQRGTIRTIISSFHSLFGFQSSSEMSSHCSPTADENSISTFYVIFSQGKCDKSRSIFDMLTLQAYPPIFRGDMGCVAVLDESQRQLQPLPSLISSLTALGKPRPGTRRAPIRIFAPSSVDSLPDEPGEAGLDASEGAKE
jgi:hypothetical protein